MNIEQAYANLVNLLMNARIKLNGDALTAVEHQQINTDLQLIYDRAQLADKLLKEKQQCGEGQKDGRTE